MGSGSKDLNIKIAELSRKLRQLEATKSHDDSRRSTKKARAKQLKKLQQLNEKARWNLFLGTETSKKISNVSNIETMASLHAKCNMFLKRIQTQQQLMRDLDDQLKDVEENQHKVRLHLASNTGQSDSLRYLRRIHRHENLLDNALTKFHDASDHNEGLRRTIEFLRKERGVFESVHKKLKRDIEKHTETAVHLAEQTETHRTQKDKLLSAMDAMRLKGEPRLFEIEQQWARLVQNLVDGKDLHEESGAAAVLWAETGEVMEFEVHDNPAHAQMRALNNRIREDGEEITARKKEIREKTDVLRNSKLRIERLQKDLNMSDVEDMVKHFVSTEEDNFHLYRQLSKLEKRIEMEEDALKKLQARANRSAVDSDTDATNALLVSRIQRLQQGLEHAEDECYSHDETKIDALQLLGCISEQCESLMKSIGLLNSKAATMYGIGVNSVSECLAEVEKRCVDLAQRRLQQLGETDGLLVVNPSTKFSDDGEDGFNVSIEVPSIDDGLDEGLANADVDEFAEVGITV